MSPMRRLAIVVAVLVVSLGVVAACGDDDAAEPPETTSSTTTASSSAPPTSTSSAPTTTSAASSSTTRPQDRCAEPPGPIASSPLVTPADAKRECDTATGWRFFFWIGESGDPIYRVQRLDGRAWVDEGYDVACGLDAATLQDLNVPPHLAAAWSAKYDEQC